MFLIRVLLKPSPIHGIGVFAGQDIRSGDGVYQHSPNLDLMLDDENFSQLDKREQEMFLHYGYRDKGTGLYRLDHDDIRFVNHSSNPNIGLKKSNGILVALKDIIPGEEILQNYNDFELKE